MLINTCFVKDIFQIKIEKNPLKQKRNFHVTESLPQKSFWKSFIYLGQEIKTFK